LKPIVTGVQDVCSSDLAAGVDETKEAIWRCVVTDDATNSVNSNSLFISVFFYPPGGGGEYVL
jgi:hypothetical protein